MAQESAPESVKRPARRGTARFWWPFAAVVLVFSGLAIAYSASDGVEEGAPGAVKKRAPDADPPTHGLEPAPAH
jgi:hypothetical protein